MSSVAINTAVLSAKATLGKESHFPLISL